MPPTAWPVWATVVPTAWPTEETVEARPGAAGWMACAAPEVAEETTPPAAAVVSWTAWDAASVTVVGAEGFAGGVGVVAGGGVGAAPVEDEDVVGVALADGAAVGVSCDGDALPVDGAAAGVEG
jgi:hypothetical protein